RPLEVFDQRQQPEGKEELRLDLDARDLVDQKGVAAEQRARDARRRRVAGEAQREQEHAVPGERQEGQHHEVVGQQRVARERGDRPGDERREQQVLREGERVVVRNERRQLEELRRRVRQRGGRVREDEAVQQRIALVAHPRAGVERQRVGREEREP